MMNRFFTLLLAASCLNAVGQTEYPYPYNPDGNNDGYISLNDLLDLLSVYGSEFNAGVLATDSISAVYYTGELDYYDCASSCVALRGNWKMLDKDLVGSYKTSIFNQTSSAWLDVRNAPMTYYGSSALSPAVVTSNWATGGFQTNDLKGCFCQTRTRADIEDINVCEGLVDECGVCNGEGAVYECGCSDLPEGDCDCEGNQVDAIGVCGGDCLEDADGDGVCDPVIGPCEGQDFVTYHGYGYEIVETADGRCWFAENLRTLTFSNGDEIQLSSATNGVGWSSFKGTSGSLINSQAGARIIDDHSYIPLLDDESVVYNFTSVIHDSGLCPTDWHVPSILEFNHLFDSYGGSPNAALSLKAPVVDGCSSITFNTSGLNVDSRLWFAANTTNSLTSSANDSRLWTSTINNPQELIYPVSAGSAIVTHCGTSGEVSTDYISLNHGFSVRCIKDAE